MKIVITTLVIFSALSLLAQEKTFVREYTYKAGEMDSKISCRAITINELRSALLNEIGVYVESESILKKSEVSGKFAEDFIENIATISAGITKLEILEEKWDGESFWMRASITIDIKSLEESLKQIIQDRQKTKELEEIKQKLIVASNEIIRLNQEVELAQNQINDAKREKYNEEINILVSAEFVNEGNAKYEIDDFKGAIQDYDNAIKFNPNNSKAYFNRGLSKEARNDHEGALKDFDKGIELDPKNARAYYDRGLIKNELRATESAIEDFSRAIELDPNYEDAYFERGLSKYQSDSSAITDFDKVIELNAKNVRCYIFRGIAKHYFGDFNAALIDFNMAIELNPTEADAYTERGLTYQSLNDSKRAISDFNKAIEFAPKNVYKVYTSRGLAKQDLRDYKGALADFDKSIELNPRLLDNPAYYYRGRAKIEIGQFESGCLDIKKSAIWIDDPSTIEREELLRKYCKK